MAAPRAGADVIVVGAGSAGAVLAARLSEDRRRTVLLLEAGPAGTLSADLYEAITTPGRTWDGLTARPSDEAAARPYLRGRGVGGSSAVNALIALRAPGPPFDGLAPWYERVEDVVQPASLRPAQWGPLDRALVDAGIGLGFAAVDHGTIGQDGVGPVALTIREGARHSVADAYLGPAWSRPNLEVRSGAEVAHLLVEDRRVAGVGLASGEVLEAGEVLLAAGAIHSPVLLLRSGLARPGVGEGLADHPSVALTLRLRPEAVLPAGRPVLATLLRAPGDLQVLALGATGHDDVGRRHGALIVAAMSTRSTGRVGVRADGSPDVVLGLLGDEADRAALRAGARLLVRLAAQPAFQGVIEAAVTDDGTPLEALVDGDDDVLDRWIATGAGPYTHAACSCARAVDEWGRLPGVSGLRVVDASTLPANPAANPHLSVLAWAERAAAATPPRSLSVT